MNGTFHMEGGKTSPEPLHGQQHTPASLPSATATITPLAPSCPPRGVQRVHCTPQTCQGMRAVRGGVMPGHGSPSSARVDPNWSSCASTALTVPCPIPGKAPAQGQLSQSAWSKVWGSQACPPSLCQGCWVHHSFHMTKVAADPTPVCADTLPAECGHQSPAWP